MAAFCVICGTEVNPCTRRYGAQSCSACAAFFSRSIEMEDTYICPRNNDCLAEANFLGKGCRRCRFDKCIAAGMITNELLEKLKGPPRNAVEDCVVFVKIMDTILRCSIKYQFLFEVYFRDQNQAIISVSLDEVNKTPLLPIPERYRYLSFLLSKYPITQAEFPLFTVLCLAKLEFKNISAEKKMELKALQASYMERLHIPSEITAIRVEEISDLSQNFLNIFYPIADEF